MIYKEDIAILGTEWAQEVLNEKIEYQEAAADDKNDERRALCPGGTNI